MLDKKTIDKILIFVRNVRLAQFVFFVLVLAVGVATAIEQGFLEAGNRAHFGDIGALVALVCAIWLAWAGSVALNDAEDVEIDRMTNAHRPLPRNQFTAGQFAQIGYILSIVALLIAGMIDRRIGILMGVFIAINYIYNVRPLRLKRVLFIGSLLPAVTIQIIAYMGFFTIAQSARFADYPFGLLEVGLAVLVLALIIPLKDIKDVRSDAHFGVRTFPVVFGVRFTKILAVVATAVFLLMRMWFTGLLTPIVSGVILMIVVLTGFLIVATSGLRAHNLRKTSWSLIAWMLIPGFIYVLVLWIIYFS